LEKPLAVDLAEAEGIVEREVEFGRRLIQVGLMRRYDPEHVAVAEQLAAGAVGEPLMFRGWHRNPPDDPPPTSTDVLVQAAVHDLYSIRWLMGREITQIYVAGTTIDPALTEHLDLQLISLTMEDGGLGIIEVNKNSGFGYEVGVEITGRAGILSTAPLHAPVVRRAGTLGQAVEADWLERFEAAYLLELRAWVAAAADGGATGPSSWDGYRTLAACVAGARSLELGAPVHIDDPSVPALYTDDA
jgi:myo-inositol 2-dehydrogenase / D-chiro-inositol 1-dehydrogenase